MSVDERSLLLLFVAMMLVGLFLWVRREGRMRKLMIQIQDSWLESRGIQKEDECAGQIDLEREYDRQRAEKRARIRQRIEAQEFERRFRESFTRTPEELKKLEE